MLARSADGGDNFDEIKLVSTTKFLWSVPAVEQATNVPGLPEDMTGRVLLVWGWPRK